MDHPEIGDFINWKVREEKKAQALIARRLRDRLQRRGLPHGQRPELEQLGPRHRRVHGARSQADGKWQTIMRTTGEVVETYKAQGPLEQDRRGAWGCADPGVQYDTTINRWHTCPNTDRINASQPVLRVHVPRRHGLQPRVAQPDEVPRAPDGSVRHRGLPPRDPRSSSSRRRSSSTSRATRPRTIAQNSHDYRPLGLGYANLGTLLMLHGHPVRLATRAARSAARSPRSCAATPTACPPRWPREGPVRRLREEPRADAARSWACTATRPTRSTATTCHADLIARGARGLGRGGAARRAARLPQRAGDRARADRHDRPPDGLRHDRHRARLRAREVQEARRRRLLQDRQPVGAGRARQPRLHRGADRRRSSRTSSGTNTLARRAAHQPRDAQGARASRTRELDEDRGRAPGGVRAAARVRAVGGRRGLPRAARHREGDAGRAPGFNLARAPRLHAGARSRRRTTYICGTHDDRGRAAPASRSTPGVRLREPLRQEGPALPPPMRPREDDGGGAAVPLGRDLEDGQPARTRPPSRRSARSTSKGWKLGLKAVALYRDGCKASQPLSSRERQEGGGGRAGRGRLAARRAPGAGATRSRSAIAAAAQQRATAAPAACGCRRSAFGFTQEAQRRRAQGLPAHRRVRGRHARRDLHRHAQGGRRLPSHDELLRDRGLDRPAVRRAARGLRRRSSRSRASSRRAWSSHPNIKLSTSIVDYIFRVLAWSTSGAPTSCR